MTAQAEAMILFLDFDGVLHGTNGPRFARLAVLKATVALYPCKIVISSSWRCHCELAELRGMLGSLSELVVGVTPNLPLRWQASECSGDLDFPRQREIEAWLAENAEPGRPFLVLDDEPTLFEPGWPPLMLIDGRTGFSKRDRRKVVEWLRAHTQDAS